MYFIKSPILLKWYFWRFPNLVWNKSRFTKTVYLTFDDGPLPIVTDFILNTLKNYQAKATFFCIGDNIEKHPETFKLIKKKGHRIGNHTYNHLKGWKTDDETYVSNFLKCQALTNTDLFRPPYGRIKKSQVNLICKAYVDLAEASNPKSETVETKQQTLNPPLQIIMWDCLSGDFDIKLNPKKCYLNVIKNVQNGSIIVFHDNLKAFERLEYTLPRVLSYLKNNSYQFGLL